ncbi:MAG TPA: glycosyltransferase family 4 protein [Nitratidesulfovibrio sp.]|nr:glycosyltransferase family 4 protein [Nitratidesulfovibrio sp.]
MHIILLTSSSTKSGGSRQALYLAEGLAARGHHVTFFTPARATLRNLAPGVLWADLPERAARWGTALADAFPANGPCVVQAFHNKAVKRLAWLGLKWRLSGRKAVCVGYRGVVFRPGNPLPYWSPGIDAFVANSQACADVLRGVGVGAGRVEVIRNGIPAARMECRTAPDQLRAALNLPGPDAATGSTPGPVIGTVAGDKEVKGVGPLLRAFAAARASGDAALAHATLVVVGVSPERWAAHCAELGIADHVRLVPPTPLVADHLRLMDLFVLPSLSESMPNTLLEAICAGLPVVASNVGGVPELLRDNGLLVPGGDVDVLATALREAMAQPERRAAWAAASRSMAPEFSASARVDRFEALYHRLLHKRGLAHA